MRNDYLDKLENAWERASMQVQHTQREWSRALARQRIAEQRALALMMSAGTKREIALAAVEHLVILAHETAEKSAACDVADAEVNFVEREMEQAEQAA